MRYRYTTLASQRVRFIEGAYSPALVQGNQGRIVGAPLIDHGMVCDGMSRGIAWNGAVIDPMQLPGLLALMDPSRNDLIVRGAAPVVVDGDMEAVGTAAYASGGATLSKQGGAYAGLQCLRLAYGGFASFYAAQGAGVGIVSGERYQTGIALRTTEGNVALRDSGGAATTGVVAVNPGAAWTYQTVDATWGASGGFRIYNFASTSYAEVDALTIQNLSFNSIANIAGVAGGFAQSTSSIKMWVSRTTINGRQVLEAEADYMSSSAPVSTWNLLHRDQDWYWFMIVQPLNMAGTRGILSNGNVVGVAVGNRTNILATGALQADIGNGAASVVAVNSAAGVLALGTAALVVCRHSKGGNVEYWVGGTRVINAVPAAAWDTTTNAAGLSLARVSPTASTGRFGHFGVGAAVLTDQMLAGLGAWAKRAYGVAWV